MQQLEGMFNNTKLPIIIENREIKDNSFKIERIYDKPDMFQDRIQDNFGDYGMYATDIGDFGFTKTKIISPYGDAGTSIPGFDIHDTFQTDNNGNPYKDHTTFNNDFHIPSIDPCKSRPDRIIPKKS